MTIRRMAIAGVIFALCCGGAFAAPMLTLNPSGFQSGTPGSTVGWGFTLSNDTAFFLLVDSSQFCEPGQDPAFTTCSAMIGTYTDYIAQNVTVVSPMSSVGPQPFSPGNPGTGVGQFVIDPGAPLLTPDAGNIIITYMEYMGDPLNGGTQQSGDIEASAMATVEAVPSATVPEPATIALAGAALLGLVLLRKRISS